MGNIANTLEIRTVLRSVVDGPLKFEFEKLTFELNGNIVHGTTAKSANISRLGVVTYFPGHGFNRKQFNPMSDRTIGKMEYVAVYGHPNGDYVRKASKTLHLDFFKKRTNNGKVASVALNWMVQQESDEPI